MALPALPMPSAPMGPMMGPSAPGQAPGRDQLENTALEAMNDLVPKESNQTAAMQRVDEALTVAHKLLMMVLPQISNFNSQVAQDLHQIAQRVLGVKGDLTKAMPVGPPPEILMQLLGGQGGPGMGAGAP